METTFFKGIVGFVTLPLSALYYAGYKIDKYLTASRILPKKVISVGNITWGGAGKTPAVIKLCEDLAELGKKAVVLTRGYGRKRKSKSGKRKAEGEKCLVVSNGQEILVGPDAAGDEPYMISEQLKNAPVIVGRNRYGSGVYAAEKFNPDIFILDDGLQHWGLDRDLDIVCINAVEPFGSGFLLPAGILREPISTLSRADLLIITNSNFVSPDAIDLLKKKILNYSRTPIVTAKVDFQCFREIFSKKSSKIIGEVVGVAAIGLNKIFRKSLELAGLTVQKFYGFRDHHHYTQKEIDKIINFHPSVNFITTHKDAVKLRNLKIPANRFYYLEIKMKVVEGEEIWQEKIKQLF